MDINVICYAIGTIFFVATLMKQFYIIILSPKDDPLLWSKILFFVFTFCMVSSTWLLFNGTPQMAIPFFIAASLISFWTYYIRRQTL
jgi:hypothetical protein